MDDNEFRKRFLYGSHSGPVYRFFQEEWQADALVKGNIWISTLETCRQYENAEQGDADEASETYSSKLASGHGSDLHMKVVANRLGIGLSDKARNITFSNNVRHARIVDGYVLCTSTEYSPDKLNETFGRYCVEIGDTKNFYLRASEAIGRSHIKMHTKLGQVTYRDRHFSGVEPRPGLVGFVKPTVPYAPQKEFRFVWIPMGLKIFKPFLLELPSVGQFCKRVG